MVKTILLIDDSITLRHIVGRALGEAGYRVLEACDGETGIQVLEREKVHLVISDLSMPRMDGLTMLRRKKELLLNRFTPVIVMTTESREEKQQEGRDAGARVWIVKPFKLEQLRAAIDRLIGAP